MINVAIDGPAGAGKSTIAKAVAKKIGFQYVDTGALYRTIALYLTRCDLDINSDADVTAAIEKLNVDIKYIDGVQHMFMNNEDVTGLIRGIEVSKYASICSQYASVREKLLGIQRDIAERENVLMDGRDIGTVVLPNADVKIFLTASVECRAKRRYDELIAQGVQCSLSDIKIDIENRDHRDTNREIAPLKQAEDAILVDSSDMTIDEVVAKICELCEKAGK